MEKVFFLSAWFCVLSVIGQETLSQELPTSFHQQRREALRGLLPPNSVAVFFANPKRNRSNDVDHEYHPSPDMYYLTGYPEPNAVLILFSEEQQDSTGVSFSELFFVQPKDELAERWNGKRWGVLVAKERTGIRMVYRNDEFKKTPIDFSSFDKVLFFDLMDDVRDSQGRETHLYDLIAHFKEEVGYVKGDGPQRKRLYALIRATEEEDSTNVAQVIDRYLQYDTSLKGDSLLTAFVSAEDESTRRETKGKIMLMEDSNLDTVMLEELMNKLREVKTPEELRLLKRAIDISVIGQIEVMKAMHPEMSETEVEGIHEFVFKKYGASHVGYPSIVGAGNNGCILHYTDNDKPKVENGLILMDVGAEYGGYTADITRTIPTNGTFTEEQRMIYELVLKAQEEAISTAVVGGRFGDTGRAARRVINRGLIRLGIARDKSQARDYFPHGTSHYLGLDVHDRGTYGPFKPNTVITIEPGIYIPEGSDCDPKWWGIAIRIEDDILITEEGPVNLSAKAPKTIEEIETMMKRPSALDDFVLPKLD